MSKRSKFVLCTWVGPNVSVMKKAKMSTDKALLKDIIQNLSVELLVESAAEFTLEHFKTEVDKAGGARYSSPLSTNIAHLRSLVLRRVLLTFGLRR